MMGAFLTWKAGTFLTTENISNVVRQFSWIAISAMGQCMVIITGGIDLAAGSVMALSGLASAEILVRGGSVLLAIIGGLATGALVGVVNGLLISKTKLPPFIATLGTMSIARGITYGATAGWPVRGLPQGFKDIGQGDLWIVPLPVMVVIILGVLTYLFLSRTTWGTYIYALGGNEQASVLSGINVNWVKVLVYTLSGLLTAFGGVLMTARLGVAAPTAASGYELDVIAAVVIGGTSLTGGEGTILGTVVGALLMRVLRNGLVLMGFSAYWEQAAIGTVIIVAIMLDQWIKAR